MQVKISFLIVLLGVKFSDWWWAAAEAAGLIFSYNMWDCCTTCWWCHCFNRLIKMSPYFASAGGKICNNGSKPSKQLSS